MARNKQIEDQELINLIEKYFREECNKTLNQFKIPLIAAYVAENGYPGYAATTLRRNDQARAYIAELIKSCKDSSISSVFGYKTLDIEEFLDNNRTRQLMKTSLTELDNYYRSIADTATHIYQQAEKQENTISQLSQKLHQEKTRYQNLKESYDMLQTELRSHKEEIKLLRSYIKDYTCPDIANKLLAMNKTIKPIENSIDDNLLSKMIISSDTEIKKTSNLNPDSNVIFKLFNNLED